MLTTEEIQRFIDEDISSEKKRLAAVGQRYYEGKHDILNCRLFYYNADGKLEEDMTRSNIKICHPFFTEMSDQLSAYMLSFDENPIRACETADGLQEKLDLYFDDDFWAEIGDLITGAYNKGFEYIYAYKNSENRLAFKCADSMGVIEVREEDTDDGCKYIIYWYIDRIEKGRKQIRRIQVWSDSETAYFVQDGASGTIELDNSVENNPRYHVIYKDKKTGKRLGYGLGYIPFYRLDNNNKQISGLSAVKGLIDDYDLHACSLSNNLVDFDTPLHVVSGYPGNDLNELQQNLKTKKIIGVDAEGDVQVRTIDVPYQARKEKLDLDEKNIYRFGFGFNSAQVGDGNVTNVVIRSRYTLLDLKANKLEKRVRRLLREILKIVLAEINQEHKKDYQLSDIWFDFTHNIMTNETENIQNAKIEAETKQIEINNILNAAASIGDVEALKAICAVLELDYEEIQGELKKQEESGLLGARAALDAADVTEPTFQPEIA